MSDFEVPIGNAPKTGAVIHLVRWNRNGDGWNPETVLGTYVSCTHEEWAIDCSRGQETLPREQWLIFQP